MEGIENINIGSLSNEVLQHVFEYLPTSHLLRSCRLASKNWRANASYKCRSRRVRLICYPGKRVYIGLGFEDLFKEDVPFSSTNDLNFLCTKTFTEYAITTFQNYLVSTAVTVDPWHYGKLVDVLTLPKLKSLKVSALFYGNRNGPRNTISDLTRLDPRNVKFRNLSMDYQPNCDFAELFKTILLLCDRSLRNVHLKLNILTPIITATECINQLLDRPKIGLSLEIPFTKMYLEIWNLLASKGALPIHTLLISFQVVSSNEVTVELPQVVKNCVGLNKLTFEVFTALPSAPASLMPPTITLTCCTSLEHLSLTFETYFSCREGFRSQRILNKLSPELIPNISKISVNRSRYKRSAAKVAVSELFVLPTSLVNSAQTFDKVTTLKLGNVMGDEEWSSVFKNICHLSCIVQEVGQLKSFLHGHYNLKSLKLEFVNNSNPTSLLTEAHKYFPGFEGLSELKFVFNKYPPKCDDLLLLLDCVPTHLTIASSRISTHEKELREHHLSFAHFVQ